MLSNLRFYFDNVIIDGEIPNTFCNKDGVVIDVSDTDIKCYTGCLTSSSILITGALPACHNGSVLRTFIAVVCIFLILILISSIIYKCAHTYYHSCMNVLLSPFAICVNWISLLIISASSTSSSERPQQ